MPEQAHSGVSKALALQHQQQPSTRHSRNEQRSRTASFSSSLWLRLLSATLKLYLQFHNYFKWVGCGVLWVNANNSGPTLAFSAVHSFTYPFPPASTSIQAAMQWATFRNSLLGLVMFFLLLKTSLERQKEWKYFSDSQEFSQSDVITFSCKEEMYIFSIYSVPH